MPPTLHHRSSLVKAILVKIVLVIPVFVESILVKTIPASLKRKRRRGKGRGRAAKHASAAALLGAFTPRPSQSRPDGMHRSATANQQHPLVVAIFVESADIIALLVNAVPANSEMRVCEGEMSLPPQLPVLPGPAQTGVS